MIERHWCDIMGVMGSYTYLLGGQIIIIIMGKVEVPKCKECKL